MAFVFRSTNNQHKTQTTPGPGQYRLVSNLKQAVLSTAPFNQTSQRNIWKENGLPGPGAYQLEEANCGEKAIIKNCGNAYGLFETPIESAIFKSHSKRFQENEDDLPGPGQYLVQVERTVKQRTTSQQNSLHKYLQKSRSQNIQQEVGLLAVGEQEERMRQSSANSYCLKKKEKKMVAFDSRQERNKPIRPQTSLGPGSYELSQAKQQKQNLNRKKITQSITKFKKIKTQTNPGQQMQIKLNNEQPQHSLEQSKNQFVKSYNARKTDFFGSTVSRFANGLLKDNTPGPGQYQINSVQSTSNIQLATKKAAFGRSSQESRMRQVFVSPFLIKKVQNERAKTKNKNKSVDRCFIFKQPRFKEVKTSQSIQKHQNQFFLGKQNTEGQRELKKRQKYSSKLVIKRDLIKKAVSDDRPLSYAAQAFTISHKNKQKCQIDAPFLSHATRFNQSTESVAAAFDKLYCQNVNQTEYKERSTPPNKSPKPKGIMDSKNPRFNYKPNETHLSPFTYDPLKPKVKQFNRLFL